MDFNSWIRQQEDSVKRTWHTLKREEDEIEHEEEVVVALGQRLSQVRDQIQVSPRQHIDALMHQVAKDEARMLRSIDAVGARLAHEKSVFRAEISRIAQSRANTPRTDRHTRQAWDYADKIWRAEEASIQERIDRVAAMGLECRRRLAASSTYSPSRRRPSVSAEPAPEEREPRTRERTKSSANAFVRERKNSAGAVLAAQREPREPLPAPAAREFVRERRPSQAVPVPVPVPSSRPVTAARPATAGASRHYQSAEDSPRERHRERERTREPREHREDRDADREHRREHRERRERTRSNAVLPTHHTSHSTSHLPSSSLPAQSHMPPHPPSHHPHPPHPPHPAHPGPPSDDRTRLAAAWTAYECRWAGLQAPIPSAPTTPLTFHNVPWPVGFQPESPRSLTPDRIKRFLLSSSHSPHRSPKERLRSALSLWRPDQWEDKWINSVEPSEREKVRYGVTVVAQCLGELLKEAAREERAHA